MIVTSILCREADNESKADKMQQLEAGVIGTLRGHFCARTSLRYRLACINKWKGHKTQRAARWGEHSMLCTICKIESSFLEASICILYKRDGDFLEAQWRRTQYPWRDTWSDSWSGKTPTWPQSAAKPASHTPWACALEAKPTTWWACPRQQKWPQEAGNTN